MTPAKGGEGRAPALAHGGIWWCGRTERQCSTVRWQASSWSPPSFCMAITASAPGVSLANAAGYTGRLSVSRLKLLHRRRGTGHTHEQGFPSSQAGAGVGTEASAQLCPIHSKAERHSSLLLALLQWRRRHLHQLDSGWRVQGLGGTWGGSMCQRCGPASGWPGQAM